MLSIGRRYEMKSSWTVSPNSNWNPNLIRKVRILAQLENPARVGTKAIHQTFAFYLRNGFPVVSRKLQCAYLSHSSFFKVIRPLAYCCRNEEHAYNFEVGAWPFFHVDLDSYPNSNAWGHTWLLHVAYITSSHDIQSEYFEKHTL